MRHNAISQGLIADISDQPKIQNVNGKQVARLQLSFVREKKGDNGQVQYFRNKFFAEAWGETAKFCETLSVGTTVMFSGEFQNYSYEGQNGEKKYGTKVVIFGIGSCGPTQYPPEQQRQQQQTGYQQQPQQGQWQQPPQHQAPPPYNHAPGAQNPPQGNGYAPQGMGQPYGQHQAPPTGQQSYGHNVPPSASPSNGGYNQAPNGYQNQPPMQGQPPTQQTGSYPPPPQFDANQQIPF